MAGGWGGPTRGEPTTSPSKVRLQTISDADPKNWAPHKYTRLDNCSIDFVTSLLSAVEPITFSRFALKAVKSNKLNTLLEVLEFACKIPRTTPLTGDLRHIPSLKQKLLGQARALNNRAHTLRLPPDWEAQGVFVLREVGQQDIVFYHRYAETTRPWPAAMRLKDSAGDVISADRLRIERNYSEDTAEVRSDLCIESFRVSNLGMFDCQGSLMKKPRLAIENMSDGSSDSVPPARFALEDGRSETATASSCGSSRSGFPASMRAIATALHTPLGRSGAAEASGDDDASNHDQSSPPPADGVAAAGSDPVMASSDAPPLVAADGGIAGDISPAPEEGDTAEAFQDFLAMDDGEPDCDEEGGSAGVKIT